MLKVIVLSRFLGKLLNIQRFNTNYWFTLLVLLFLPEILKKKKKKSSENDQVFFYIFRAFLFCFFRPRDPNSEKKSRKSTNKKILASLCVFGEIPHSDFKANFGLSVIH